MSSRRMSFGAAAGMAALLGAHAAAGALAVTVVDGNTAVPGAQVCVGSLANRAAIGTALTNAAGVAVFAQVPSSAILVTASHLGRGAEASVVPTGSNTSLTLRLAAGGLGCSGPPPIRTLPPGPAVPGDGGTVLVPTPFVLKETPVPVTLPTVSVVFKRKTEFCFGALGAGCGGAQFDIPVLALCGFGSCSINSGSWLHDECCSSHPHGMACQYGPLDAITGNDGTCVAEWNRSLNRLPDYTWRRDVDFNKPNATGIVVFADYCAREGSHVHQDDVARFCCSGRAHALVVASKFADTNLRVCD
ncbi:MAG: carboxypeptidase-like regulatory domain-containing protein [Thermoanaerobaculia bacterium]